MMNSGLSWFERSCIPKPETRMDGEAAVATAEGGEEAHHQPRSRTEIRMKEFESMLETEELDMKRIRKLCHAGVPDFPGMRAMYWKVRNFHSLFFLPSPACFEFKSVYVYTFSSVVRRVGRAVRWRLHLRLLLRILAGNVVS